MKSSLIVFASFFATIGLTGCAGLYQTPVSQLAADSAKLNNIQPAGKAPLQFVMSDTQRQQSFTVRGIKGPTLGNIKYVFEPYKMLEIVAKERFTGSDQYDLIPEITKWDYDHLEPFGYWGASFEITAKLTVQGKNDGKVIFQKTYQGKGSNGQLDTVRISGNPIMVTREIMQRMEGIAGIDAAQDIFNQFIKDWNSLTKNNIADSGSITQ